MKVAPKAKSKTVFPLANATPRKAGAGRPRSMKFRRDVAVMRYMRDVKEAAPWLEAADMPLVRRFCEFQVLIAHYFFEIRQHGWCDENEAPRPILETYRRAVIAQAGIANQLGLSPLARKQLATSAERDDLASLLAKSANSDSTAETIEPEQPDAASESS